MSNWFKTIAENPSQSAQALAEGATFGTSKAISPALGYLGAKTYASISPSLERSDVPSLKESYKLYNDQRQEFQKQNPMLDLALQIGGNIPAAIATGGTSSLGSMAKYGAATGLASSASDIVSRKSGTGEEYKTSDLTDLGMSTALGGIFGLGGGVVGAGIGKATSKVAPFLGNAYKDIIDKDPVKKAFVENIKKLPKDKVAKIRDFLHRPEQEALSYAGLKEKTLSEVDKAYRAGIRKEINPEYNKVFYQGGKAKVIMADKVDELFKNPNYAKEIKELKEGLSNDDRLVFQGTNPKDNIRLPENSVAYLHFLRSQAKSKLNRFIKEDKVTPLVEGRLAAKNTYSKLVNDMDALLDSNLKLGQKTQLALTDEKYSGLVNIKDDALSNIASDNITPEAKKTIMSYAGKDFEPHLDFMDLVNRTPSASPKLEGDSMGVEALKMATNIASGNKAGVVGGAGRFGGKIIGGKAPSEIYNIGDYLTGAEGKNLFNDLVKAKSAGDKREAIIKGITGFGKATGLATGGNFASQQTGNILDSRVPSDITPVVSQPLQPISRDELFNDSNSQQNMLPRNYIQPISREELGL